MATKKHIFLSVMGTLGVGKTTAATLLAKEFEATLVKENYQDNPFLPRFYGDMKRWAFHSQAFFLLEKARQLEEISELLKKKSIIQDTPLIQDVFSYAKAQWELHNMDNEEWKLYLKLFSGIEKHLPIPDGIVYLDSSVKTIEGRIATRGREFEKSIPTSYLTLLDQLNHDWLKKNSTIPVCVIHTDHMDFEHKKEDKKQFLEAVHACLKR